MPVTQEVEGSSPFVSVRFFLNMLSVIRDKLKTWVVVILVVLVAIPLIFLGVGDYGS